ncbi:MAG: hypothetical protein KatS3mg111_3934 [Pirellulaceae bacterium]|nr:MAG: hypothetical protein KatS3mg111_3934 [Pirellulaceae bacterium]
MLASPTPRHGESVGGAGRATIGVGGRICEGVGPPHVAIVRRHSSRHEVLRCRCAAKTVEGQTGASSRPRFLSCAVELEMVADQLPIGSIAQPLQERGIDGERQESYRSVGKRCIDAAMMGTGESADE